ncbi:hypothetical protein [Ornithinimicrobium sp. INDO-MA30-4]|uniref:hypothetical protein n=1 Tax=Ornithinimicrobium sp. INDO-MA30-4 TaxID=2908651 RepID=UPI0037CBA901
MLAAAILFGTTGTAQALGPTDSSPLSVGAARLVIGGIALLVLLPLVGGRRREALNLWRTLVASLRGCAPPHTNSRSLPPSNRAVSRSAH